MTCHTTPDGRGITCTRTVPASGGPAGLAFDSVPTSALRAGDVVRTHGMRVLLTDVCAIDGTDRGDGPTVASRGRVLNPDEVRAARVVPWSWLFHGSESEPHWTVQGNDLAYWTVER